MNDQLCTLRLYAQSISCLVAYSSLGSNMVSND